jgi:hypothetical protein
MFKLAHRALSQSKKLAQSNKPHVQQAADAPKMLDADLLKRVGGGTAGATDSPRNGW